MYLNWFREISDRTCRLIVDWMRVGFVHGVLNTDNMSIIGETIDYGPYGWIDDFDLDWTPNTSDRHENRYAFGRQASVSQWNIMQLANAIYPLISYLNQLDVHSDPDGVLKLTLCMQTCHVLLEVSNYVSDS